MTPQAATASTPSTPSLSIDAKRLAAEPGLIAPLGDFFLTQKNRAPYIALLEEALALNPDMAIRRELVRFLMLGAEYHDALGHLRTLYKEPGEQDLVLYVNYLYALENTGAYEEAVPIAEEANHMFPANALLLSLRGSLHQSWGRWESMLKDYRAAHMLTPENPRIAYTLALQEMMAGEMETGLRNYGLRHTIQPTMIRLPLWNPEMKDARILLSAEQGVGDTLMFLRLLPWLAARTKEIGMEVPETLLPLLSRTFPDIRFYRMHTAPFISYDAGLPIGDLWPLAGPDILGDASAPFLKADDKAVETLRAQYRAKAAAEGKTRVLGIAWQSINPYNGQQRSIPMKSLLPLLANPEILWVDMQYGEHADTTRWFGEHGITLLQDGETSLQHQADQIMAVDGIITSDNTLVHLAGGLGQKTLLLLSMASDWRWGVGDTTAWQPSVSILRQSTPVDWNKPVAEVRKLLAEGWPA